MDSVRFRLVPNRALQHLIQSILNGWTLHRGLRVCFAIWVGLGVVLLVVVVVDVLVVVVEVVVDVVLVVVDVVDVDVELVDVVVRNRRTTSVVVTGASFLRIIQSFRMSSTNIYTCTGLDTHDTFWSL